MIRQCINVFILHKYHTRLWHKRSLTNTLNYNGPVIKNKLQTQMRLKYNQNHLWCGWEGDARLLITYANNNMLK